MGEGSVTTALVLCLSLLPCLSCRVPVVALQPVPFPCWRAEIFVMNGCFILSDATFAPAELTIWFSLFSLLVW